VSLLASLDVQQLETDVEEATRANPQGARRFVEPAEGTLRRAVSKRHHIVFGRRGSGKSSLLRKAAADLAVDRRPIAYVDLETFKGHSYPDVLLSVLIEAFSRFEDWLRTTAVNPASRRKWWQKLFGRSPTRKPLNARNAAELADKLKGKIDELKALLHGPDDVSTTEKHTRMAAESSTGEVGARLGTDTAGVSVKEAETQSSSAGRETTVQFQHKKTDFLHRHILGSPNHNAGRLSTTLRRALAGVIAHLELYGARIASI
jgi:hypothetical protein